MVERSQKDVWKLTPWVAGALLLVNFVFLAFNARNPEGEMVVRTWSQALAVFVQSPVSSIKTSVGGFFESFSSMRTAVTENDQLRERVLQLETQVRESETLTSENERLKGLLNFQNESKYKILPGRVIARDPSTWFDMATINRGSLDGVKLNMPVVTSDGLAGRVIAVSPVTAQFILLPDEKSAAAAVIGEIGSSNALGVVRGTGEKGVLEMRYVPGYEKVEVGEMVFTSGQDGLFPAGIKIGEIVEVRSGSATVPHTIFIRPAVRMSALSEVAILLYQAPPRQKPEQALPNVNTNSNTQGGAKK
jgi:rod shape-determining protein MreC